MALNTDEITAMQVLGEEGTHTMWNISLPRAIANLAHHVRDLWNRTNLDSIYPVGSVYICMTPSMTSPAEIFGGRWELLPNRFLVGAGGSYAAGTTGGSDTAEQTFISLGHGHTVPYYVNTGAATQATTATDTRLSEYYGSFEQHISFPTIPPYIAVYMWVRTE